MIALHFLPVLYPLYEMASSIYGIRSYSQQKLQNGLYISDRAADLMETCGLQKKNQIIVALHISTSGLGGMCAGADWLPFYKFISIDERIYTVDPEAAKFVVKHEIAHIKNNDALMNPLLQIICAIAFSLLFSKLQLHPLLSIILTCVSVFLVCISYSRFCEGRADDFAIKNGTADQIKGAIKLKQAQLNYEARNHFYQTDLWHPSLASRIKKFSTAYKAKTNLEYTPSQQELSLLESYHWGTS